ncbi:MAG: alanine--tRNA ligase [Simkaniaceae bacterium]
MLSNEIRLKFLQYFKERGHTLVPSSPVIPSDDPTLLFINAGMNQFKDVFLGKKIPDYSRAVSAQKCIRVGGKHNDLDNVGHTSRHMTFFEMLGNFSFGDYFKKEAIAFAIDVTLNVFELPKEKLWVSVFREDDEAFELWREHLDESRIVRMDEKENFWSMGDVGPCGPCSELLFDRGEAYGKAQNPLEDEGGERFPEFWNLVFMEQSCDLKGKISPLPQKNIDTGAGLERVLAFKMGIDSVFQTDILSGLISEIERFSNQKYNPKDPHLSPAFHVIADHIRTLFFAIADGAAPSNEMRGYVLRKILRRAIRYGKRLHQNGPFLAKLLPPLTQMMGNAYPELKSIEAHAAEIISLEEENFFKTLKRGGNILSSVIEKAEKKRDRCISGEEAFKLKDTFGFPLEEILLIAKDNDLKINLDAYEILEEKAKELSRSSRQTINETDSPKLFAQFVNEHGTSSFTGYHEELSEGAIIGLFHENAFVDKLEEGQEGLIILNRTPFYAEKGGQISDQGELSHHKALFSVSSVDAPFPDVIAHKGIMKKGTFLLGEPVNAMIDHQRRLRISAHHTGTHLLNWALERVLGPHVKQAGSFVEAKRLRFDFSHHKALTLDEIREIELIVNHKIRENLAIKTYELSYEEAQKKSEIKQMFGEKYGKIVRVVQCGDFSYELCGGTHVSSLGSLGYFRILKESSIGSSLRRIEASCGPLSEAHAYEIEDRLIEASELLGCPSNQFLTRMQLLIDDNKRLKVSETQFRKNQLKDLVSDLEEKVENASSIPLVTALVDVEADDLGPLANDLMQKLKSAVILLAIETQGRCQLLLRVSSDFVEKGIFANELIREISPCIKGGGGGKKEAASAGGKDSSGIPNAFQKLKSLLDEKCS